MFFVLSTGRSGTKSIAKTLSTLPDCVCLHEPEPALILESSACRYGKLDGEAVARMLIQTRAPYQEGKIYGESNQTLSLLIPVLVNTFPAARFVWLIRNGLDVVASTVGRQWYTGHSSNHDRYEDCPPIERRWIDGRIEGDRCGDVPADQWSEMNPFARCCWYWSYINRIIEDDLQHLAGIDNWRLIRLEDIDRELISLLPWLGLRVVESLGVARHNKAHYPVYRSSQWSEEEWAVFTYWCGPMMDKFYPGWQESRGRKRNTHPIVAVQQPAGGRSRGDSVEGGTGYGDRPLICYTSGRVISPRVSVYVTSYNQREYLREALDSVLDQTLTPHQILVVDDASTDGSQELIRSYCDRHPSLVQAIMHPMNQGVIQSRRDALQVITGDYVTYVDGDDRLLPGKLETELNRLLDTPDAHIVHSNYAYIDSGGQQIGCWADGVQHPPQGAVFTRAFARQYPRSSLYRTEMAHYQVWKAVYFYDSRISIYEDYDLRIRMSRHFRTVYVDEVLSEYRLHGQGLSSAKLAQHLRSLDYIFWKNRPLLFQLSSSEREDVERAFNVYKYKLTLRAIKEMSGVDPESMA